MRWDDDDDDDDDAASAASAAGGGGYDSHQNNHHNNDQLFIYDEIHDDSRVCFDGGYDDPSVYALWWSFVHEVLRA